jgi:hypothetical protein
MANGMNCKGRKEKYDSYILEKSKLVGTHGTAV